MAISTRSRSGSTPSSRQSRSSAPATEPTLPARQTISKKSKTNKSKATAATKTGINPSTARKLPDLTLICDDGKPRRIVSFLTDETPAMILFSYPRANTGGCTTQSCGLSSLAADAKKVGYVILGVSYDSVKSQASWKAKHSMQVEHLLCDTLDIGLLKKLGAHKAPKSVKRSVFIIRRGGMGGDGTDPVIVESRIIISPKDCISFVEQYIKDHPCVGNTSSTQKPAASKVNDDSDEGASEGMDEMKKINNDDDDMGADDSTKEEKDAGASSKDKDGGMKDDDNKQ